MQRCGQDCGGSWGIVKCSELTAWHSYHLKEGVVRVGTGALIQAVWGRNFLMRAATFSEGMLPETVDHTRKPSRN
jgi:hypothetical protein